MQIWSPNGTSYNVMLLWMRKYLHARTHMWTLFLTFHDWQRLFYKNCTYSGWTCKTWRLRFSFRLVLMVQTGHCSRGSCPHSRLWCAVKCLSQRYERPQPWQGKSLIFCSLVWPCAELATLQYFKNVSAVHVCLMPLFMSSFLNIQTLDHLWNPEMKEDKLKCCSITENPLCYCGHLQISISNFSFMPFISYCILHSVKEEISILAWSPHILVSWSVSTLEKAAAFISQQNNWHET